MKKAKVLITGGAGYIGSVLTKYLLDRAFDVTVIDNLMYHQTGLFGVCNYPNFNFIYGDARDSNLLKEHVKNKDVIIPLACIVGAPACDNNKQTAETTNVCTIKTLLSPTIISKDQLIIYPTTNSGYGTQDSSNLLCTESTPLTPITLYGRLKAEAENYLLTYHSNSISLRLATVFGMSPRMRTDLLVNDFVLKALTDRSIVLFEKDFMRNYVYIGDIAACMYYCIQHRDDMAHNIYNVGNDSLNMSKEDLALQIKKYIPELYIHEAATGRDPDKRNYIVSSKKLANAGFIARTNLDTGIKELIKGYSMIRKEHYGNA